MYQDDQIRVAYAFRDGAHSFHAEDPRTGEIRIAHGVPEVAYQEVTRELTERAARTLGRRVEARPALPFADFFNWLRMNPIANLPGSSVHVEFAWEIRH
ncbi:MAG TPA: hypothetical protein VEB20_09440 [Azospirillaceae bacterium]|nr:hypothetical protein [Azospirillaceae bacterium]